MNGRHHRLALLVVGLAATDGPAAAQELVPALVRMDSLGVLRQLAAAGFEVAGIERVAGVPHAVIVTAAPERRRLDAIGLPAQALTLAPTAPPVHFRSLARMQATLDALALAGRVTLDTIGLSWEGRPIVAAKVGTAGDAPERPNVVLLGLHHAREWIAGEMAMRLLEYLVGTPDDPALVAQRDIWVIPVVNPDGYAYSLDGERLWRKNRRPQADGAVGVDLNRNYPAFWGIDDVGSSDVTAAETYRGAAPASEPETQAVIAFHERYPPAVALSYHSYSDLVLYPYAHASGALPADLSFFGAVAGTPLDPRVHDLLPESARAAYYPGPAWHLYPTNGDYTEWAYRAHGVLAFTVELTAGCCAAGASYGFVFPDDSAAIARVVDDNLPLAMAVLRAAGATPDAAPAWEAVWPEARLVMPVGVVPDVRVAGPRTGTLDLRSDSLDRGVGGWRWRAGVSGDASGLLLRLAGHAEIQVVFADGAERSTGWTGWPRASTASLEGTWHWQAEDGSLRSPLISLSGVTRPQVALWVRHEGSLFLPERYATVEVSTDDVHWTNLLRLEGAATTWYPVTAALPSANSVRLRVTAHEMMVGVDAVHVFGESESRAFAAQAGELGVSENPVRSSRVFFTWEPGVGDARLSVFTLTGLLVYRASVPAAEGLATWDLTDVGGAPVGNGGYAVILEQDGQVLRRRLFVGRRP